MGIRVNFSLGQITHRSGGTPAAEEQYAEVTAASVPPLLNCADCVQIGQTWRSGCRFGLGEVIGCGKSRSSKVEGRRSGVKCRGATALFRLKGKCYKCNSAVFY